MARKSNRKLKAHGSREGELAFRVKELRKSLGISQWQLAALLEVSRSQVGEWETGGNEHPSVSKLLSMANLATSPEQRRWLLLKAGLNLEMIRRDFHEELKAAIDTRSAGSAFEVPVVEVTSLVKETDQTLKRGEERIGVPLQILAHPTATICVRYGVCPPWSMISDGLAVVDRAVTAPDGLIGRMVAVVASRLPPWSDLPQQRGDSSRWSEPRPWPDFVLTPRGSLLTVRSGLIIGRFEIDCDEEFVPGGWRLILHLGVQATKQTRFVLSSWLNTSESPTNLERFINNDYRIVGEVIGWMKDPVRKTSR